MLNDDILYQAGLFCAICGCEIQSYEVCEDCEEQITSEGIDPYEEDEEWEIEE